MEVLVLSQHQFTELVLVDGDTIKLDNVECDGVEYKLVFSDNNGKKMLVLLKAINLGVISSSKDGKKIGTIGSCNIYAYICNKDVDSNREKCLLLMNGLSWNKSDILALKGFPSSGGPCILIDILVSNNKLSFVSAKIKKGNIDLLSLVHMDRALI